MPVGFSVKKNLSQTESLGRDIHKPRNLAKSVTAE
jgi:glucosamine 6-phosphate synthetase-like amidotransferase/phosphosugar isomerase protein